MFRKRPYIALLFPAIINGFIIGLGLYYVFNYPYLISVATVFIGEFIVVYVIGLPLYYLLKKYNFEEIFLD